jgi:hypothetical protein
MHTNNSLPDIKLSDKILCFIFDFASMARAYAMGRGVCYGTRSRKKSIYSLTNSHHPPFKKKKKTLSSSITSLFAFICTCK